MKLSLPIVILWLFPVFGAASMAGCRVIEPASLVSSNPTPLKPGQVDISQLQPAQGHLAPGVTVYNEFGFVLGQVVKVDPDYMFPWSKASGTRGAVLFRVNDDKEPPAYLTFQAFDNAKVLK
ncbi:hypothetical protein EON83_30230 [bacterium]|nr:MAG: hypothetical protein EON83_30230 [bacterium]